MCVKKAIPEILVSSIDRSAAFYKDLLGLELEVLYQVDGVDQYARIGDNGFVVLLNRQPDRGDLPSGQPPAKLVFVIEGIEEHHRRLREAGQDVEDIEQSEYGTKEFAVTDPDGYRVFLVEREGEWSW